MNDYDVIPAEEAERPGDIISGTELATVVNTHQIQAMEEAARLVKRFRDLVMKYCADCTYDNDWAVMGDGDKARACLGSAGAERIAAMVKGFSREPYCDPQRYNVTDGDGKIIGYGWVYTVRVSFMGASVVVEGRYSTRDKLLGKTGGRFRSVEEINEADIRAAAMHKAYGEGIKQLLGLRNLPVSVLEELGKRRKGGDGKPAMAEVQHDAPNTKRKKITDMLLYINDGEADAAVAHLEAITKDGDKPGVKNTQELSGGRLDAVFAKVQAAHAEFQAGIEGANP